MWIVPKNYPHYLVSAQDIVGSKKELSELSDQLEHSLMWRSKPSQLRTWLTRWNKGGWFQRLCGRMLKPSRQKCFVDALTSSLLVILASHLAQQESEKGKTTIGTCGPLSGSTYKQLNLPFAFSKTSKGTSRLDSPLSYQIWKKMVIQHRGEYSARLKLAHLTNESEFISLHTPSNQGPGDLWPTLRASMGSQDKSGKKKTRYQIPAAVKINWPTVTVQDSKNNGGKSQTRRNSVPLNTLVGLQGQGSNSSSGKSREQYNWQTPEARNQVGYHVQKNGSKTLKLGSQVAAEGSKMPIWLTPKVPSGGGQAVRTTPGGGLRKLEDQTEPMNRSGKLNADWVEQLMGLPVGMTQLSTAVSTKENRINRLRMLGNGVVPQTAEKAFRTLSIRIYNEL